MNTRALVLGFSASLLLAATPARAADPHDIIGGLIGLGLVAHVLDDGEHTDYPDYEERDVYAHYEVYEPPRYEDDRRYGHPHRRGLGGHEARDLCERALYREKSNYVLRDIDDFRYDRRRGQYSMLLEARKHGNGKWRRYWCEVDARSGYVDLEQIPDRR